MHWAHDYLLGFAKTVHFFRIGNSVLMCLRNLGLLLFHIIVRTEFVSKICQNASLYKWQTASFIRKRKARTYYIWEFFGVFFK